MKNVTSQYKDLLEGKMSKNNFLRNVKMMFPNFVGSNTSANDAISILKKKRILSEEIEKAYEKKELINEAKTDSGFTYINQKEEKNPVDYVDPYQLKRGTELELSKMTDISGNAYQVALQKAANNLKKDPYFYKELQIANFKEVKKYDEKLEMKKVSSKDKKDTNSDGHLKKALKKNEAANTKATKTENKKGKPKGVEVMKESVLSELKTIKKKAKESLKEDTHWKYTRGSEIYTPDGVGTIEDIVGGTISVKLDNGTVKDYQVNILDRQPDSQDMSSTPNKFSKFQNPFEEEKKEEKGDKMHQIVKKLKEFFSKKKAKKEAVDIVTAKSTEGDTQTVATLPAGQGKRKAAQLKSQGVTTADAQTLK